MSDHSNHNVAFHDRNSADIILGISSTLSAGWPRRAGVEQLTHRHRGDLHISKSCLSHENNNHLKWRSQAMILTRGELIDLAASGITKGNGRNARSRWRGVASRKWIFK
jgi:hypothetical protein